jgi:formylglycine-generating enzyme required for sulfatase activity
LTLIKIFTVKMTQEEKAKAYDEALRIAKSKYDLVCYLSNDTKLSALAFKNTLTSIFPELKESCIHNVKWFNVNGVAFNMIYVSGGTFTMGITLEQGSDAESDEKPAHQVTLSSYYIGETEVTQALWQAVMGSNPSRFKGSNLPVEQVSWNDCQEFITKLNATTGQKFRLPTEAEWEYAACGGKNSKGYKYSGSNNINDVAWYWKNSDFNTHPVKTKQPNELGIYDMSGNVWEWCNDRWGNYSSNAQTNPAGPSSGSYRANRGGAWDYNARYCSVSYRGCDAPYNHLDGLGLRLAL